MTEELPTNVQEALSPETFDVLEFVSGKGTPMDDITIYTDNEAGYRLAKLAEMEAASAKRGEVEGLGIADELDWVDPDEVAELSERITSSALTFNLRGIAPAAKTAIRANLVAKHNFSEKTPAEDNSAFFEDFTCTLIAKTVTSVTKANGGTDSKPWTVERVGALREILNESEFQRLDTAVYSLNYNTDVYDRAVSADFLSKR